jgi:aryl-alcohol dehydrogenase-like predicted oxidoreductase
MTEDHAAGVVRAALEMGITMIDTARYYGTEAPVGRALQGWQRDGLVISSKHGYLDPDRNLLSAEAFGRGVDESLRALGLETIDIYFIHGLRLPFYQAAVERFIPVLEQARQAGKIRFIGVTEAFESDTRHEMLSRAVQDDWWDSMMVGFNLLNPSARERVLAATQRKRIATLGMFAVRRALIDEDRLRILLGRMAEAGAIDPALAGEADLMASLGLRGVCDTLFEAAYRFAAYEPGMDCVLVGTSSADHLRANLHAVAKGPLPQAALDRLAQVFGRVDSVSGQIR